MLLLADFIAHNINNVYQFDNLDNLNTYIILSEPSAVLSIYVLIIHILSEETYNIQFVLFPSLS